MKRKFITKILLRSLTVIGILFFVLCVHLYFVTRPKAPGPNTVAMARIDFNQVITKDDAVIISSWLYQQPGVNHVLCNSESAIAVFSFHPFKTNANKVIHDFIAATKYKADRYLPSKEELQNSCPVMNNSFSSKLYRFFKNL